MTLLWAILLLPAACALASALLPTPRLVLGLGVAGSLAEAALVAALVPDGLEGRSFAADGHLFVDPLSTVNLVLVAAVFAFASAYAWSYFAPRVRDGTFPRAMARRFGAAWFGFLTSMVLVLIANNVGVMWVAMEATTLASALLVCLEFDAPAVRASWTYLLICSVGIALALLGTFLLCGEGQIVAAPGQSPFLWTDLSALAPHMHPGAVRLAFVFLLVGYGTKAGLAPMHTWLPGAHGQAATPVSAVLSGVLLNCAVYAVSRFLPITEAATGGDGWALRLLVPFGLVSIGIATAALLHENDIKRFLAFCSVEHIGIIALGLGLGGTTAALFHTMNHSIAKMLAFFCAGRVVHRTGTRDMRRMGGILAVAPLAGTGLVLAFLALVGAPPFATFMSELGIVFAGAQGGSLAALAFFLPAVAVISVVMIRQAVRMIWQPATEPLHEGSSVPADWALLGLPLVALLVLGLWMPDALSGALEKAAAVIRGVP